VHQILQSGHIYAPAATYRGRFAGRADTISQLRVSLLLTIIVAIAGLALVAALLRSARRAERERVRLAATIEHLAEGLIVSDGAGTADPGRIASVNPRAAELLPELVVGGHVDGAASPLPRLTAALDGEVEISHGGHVLAVTASRLGGPADAIAWIVRDATQHARLERAKSEFVATASHELRSPLTSIKGFAELLGRDPSGLSERQREFVEIISRSTDRLVELVDDLLDVARIEADEVELDRRPIDVGEAVHETADLMRARVAAKDQALGIYIAPTLPLAMADPQRIRHVIANLLTNAHLYTPAGGRIHIGIEADRAWVRLVVADSGIGMTAEETERVFDRFYRAPSGTAAAAGTGLGLSIVKSLVDLHGGAIEVTSEPGRGSEFHVMLPAAGAEPGDSVALMRGRRVLIVDDERRIGDLIARELAPLDVETTVVQSGRAALSALDEDRYDVVTLDLRMPEMDGLAVVREIRADPELQTTPIVFVCGAADRAQLAGEWVAAKPIDPDQLRSVLTAAVRAGRSRALVVARAGAQATLEPALDELGIEYHWETTGAAAARVCGERRFEVALIDIGIRNPEAALEALALRGRRLQRAVILFSDGSSPTPSTIAKQGTPVVAVKDAPQAVLHALRGRPSTSEWMNDEAQNRD
jgi:signal transduction histidine kinase/DNA-binding NarL/FixJ family response regulator